MVQNNLEQSPKSSLTIVSKVLLLGIDCDPKRCSTSLQILDLTEKNLLLTNIDLFYRIIVDEKLKQVL